MKFANRSEAGKLLAGKLMQYKDKDVVVFAIPRGGVLPAIEVAIYLNAQLDLLIVRKIGHPLNNEYAIAAITETGHLVGAKGALSIVDKDWLHKEVAQQKLEAKRRRAFYMQEISKAKIQGKTAIIVDDGAATGLTILAAIKSITYHQPKEIIVAVPIIPASSAARIKQEVDTLVALSIPHKYTYLGSVGAYYSTFPQVEDEEVIALLKKYKQYFREKHKVSHYLHY